MFRRSRVQIQGPDTRWFQIYLSNKLYCCLARRKINKNRPGMVHLKTLYLKAKYLKVDYFENPKKQLLRDTSVTLLCDFKVTWHQFFLQKQPKHLVTFWAILIPTAYYVKTAAISFWTTFEFLGYFLFNIWSHWMPTMFIDTYPLQMLKQTILVLYNKHILPTFGNKNTSSSSKQPFEKHTHAQIDTHCLFHSHTPTDSVTRSGAMLSIWQFSGVISIS